MAGIQIPATQPGIRAVKTIAQRGPESDPIKLNLIQVQGLTHAITCFLAGPFAITISVGPVSNHIYSTGWSCGGDRLHNHSLNRIGPALRAQILRWHEAASPTIFSSLHPLQHPGMEKIHEIRLFFQNHRMPIKLLAAECRKECHTLPSNCILTTHRIRLSLTA